MTALATTGDRYSPWQIPRAAAPWRRLAAVIVGEIVDYLQGK
jgi:hypothetical protein